MTIFWSHATQHEIGADWLAARIAPASGYGRRARARELPFRRGDEQAARTALERVARLAVEATQSELTAICAIVARAPEVFEPLERARAGAVLDDVDFFELGTFLSALDDVCARTVGRSFDSIALHGGNRVRAALAAGFASGGSFYLDDAFDEVLAQHRARARAAQTALDLVRSHARRDVARALGRDSLREGEFTVTRERATALPPGVRVEREGPQSSLCRLEPQADELRALAARDQAADAVAAREAIVRARLSEVVASEATEFEAARDALGELDALVCRALFTQRYACVVPEIDDDAHVQLSEFRFLPLEAELRAAGRVFAPLDVEIDGVAVVSGPNMGGKTVALRALGFAAACVALGVPLPAAAARLPLVDAIAWLGADRATGDGGLLSAFGAEVVALRALLVAQVPRLLVLVDEFARTTSPAEGRALTIAVVRAFAARAALGFVATHYTSVANTANVEHFTSGRLGAYASQRTDSLDAALARIAEAMEYGLTRVTSAGAPPSDALGLAEALGLDRAIVADARAALE